MEDYLNRLKDKLSRIAQIDEEVWNTFSKSIELKKIPRKEYLLKAGQIENEMRFICEGHTRTFFLKDDKEHCLDFCFENDFITSFTSFLKRTPSNIYIQALSDVIVLSFQHDSLERLYEVSKKGEHIGRIIAEALYIRKSQREINLLSLSAEERYNELITKNAKLVQNIPVKYLASYLGIHPESLSRIRSKLK